MNNGWSLVWVNADIFGSRLVLLPGSGLENAVETLLGSSGCDSLQPGTLGGGGRT